MEKFYIVYRTTNILSGKYYIGSHSTYKVEDGYLGSGKILKMAIRKYGRPNFSREILCFCTTHEAMRQVETALVRYAIDTDKRECYNRSYSGTGAMLGEDNPFYGKKHSQATRDLISQKNKGRFGEANGFYGRKHKKATIEFLRNRSINTDTCLAMRNMCVNNSKYWWCTPWGCFYSDRYAAKCSDGVGRCAVKNRCSNPEKLVKPNYQIPEYYWGNTWRENGYYKIDKDIKSL